MYGFELPTSSTITGAREESVHHAKCPDMYIDSYCDTRALLAPAELLPDIVLFRQVSMFDLWSYFGSWWVARVNVQRISAWSAVDFDMCEVQAWKLRHQSKYLCISVISTLGINRTHVLSDSWSKCSEDIPGGILNWFAPENRTKQQGVWLVGTPFLRLH